VGLIDLVDRSAAIVRGLATQCLECGLITPCVLSSQTGSGFGFITVFYFFFFEKNQERKKLLKQITMYPNTGKYLDENEHKITSIIIITKHIYEIAFLCC
jgi:hypothetical protein